MRSLLKRASFIVASSLSLIGLSTVIAPVYGQTIYGLSGDELIRFDAATPGTVTVIGTPNAFLSNISFRPSDGKLYGYETSFTGTDSLYTIDLNTAAVTLVATSTPGTNTAHVGTAFDPNTDELRVITDIGENRGVTIESSDTAVGPDINYAAGDQFEGQFPLLIDIAHAPQGGPFYGIDYLRDTLVRLDPPSSGTLSTVGGLGIDTDFITGFDIFQNSDSVVGYASLGGSFFPTIKPSILATINLETGAATPIGEIGAIGVYSLAIAPTVANASAPEPSALALAAALLPIILVMRRLGRKEKVTEL